MMSCGCASWNQDAGVENRWRSEAVPSWTTGVTTDAEVMEFLGPPSQIISLRDETVFYYLKENMSGRGYVTIIYNQARIKIAYDRAIFFFDSKGKLTRYSYSDEKLDYGE